MTEISVAMQQVIIQLSSENDALETALANARTENERLIVASEAMEAMEFSLLIANGRASLGERWVEMAVKIIQDGFDLMPVPEMLRWHGARAFLDSVPRKGDAK